MNDHLIYADAGKERLEQFIDEANEHRRARQFEAPKQESAIFALLRTWLSNMQKALSNAANTRNTKPSDQPVKTSL